MAGISISESSHELIETIAYNQHTSRKDVADKMVEFINKRKEEFTREMF